MGYIYCITNLINGKKYVGKTTNSIQERFQEHCKDSKKERCEKRPLYDAFNKYGIENFKVEQLEEADEEVLSDRETYWIEKLSTYHLGYNATKGGDGKILFDYKEICNLHLKGKSAHEISNELGCSQDTVLKALHKYKIDIVRSSAKYIEQLDLQDNVLNTFGGSLRAAEYLVSINKAKNIHSASNHIINCCNGKQKKCGGFKWRYK